MENVLDFLPRIENLSIGSHEIVLDVLPCLDGLDGGLDVEGWVGVEDE